MPGHFGIRRELDQFWADLVPGTIGETRFHIPLIIHARRSETLKLSSKQDRRCGGKLQDLSGMLDTTAA